MEGSDIFTKASLFGMSGRGSIKDVLEDSTPGFGFLQGIFTTWLNIDLGTLAIILTLLGTFSSGVVALHGIGVKIYWWIMRFFMAAISIDGNDRLNHEVLDWVGAHVLKRQGARILTAQSEPAPHSNRHRFNDDKVERNDLATEKRVPVQYLPTFGTTRFIFDRNLFLVQRINDNRYYKSDKDNVPDEFALAPQGNEPVLVMCLGRSVAPIKKFLEACRDFAEKQRESYTTVRIPEPDYPHGTWGATILRATRPLDTVHFDEKTKADLVADITNYLDPDTRKFYAERGIPYRRGYLMHGPPGTGKTSLSLALAGHFGLELYLLHIPSIKDDSELGKLFSSLPPRCFILLEDVDAVGLMGRRDKFKRPVDDDSDSDSDDNSSSSSASVSRCTLSGLLNVLDGVASQEGRIVLMTSNFKDELDGALVRPGRIDKMIFLGQISQRSAELMFLRMYAADFESTIIDSETEKTETGQLQSLATEFSKKIPEGTFAPAQVQGFLLGHRSSPKRAVAEVSEWAVTEKAAMDEAEQRAAELLSRTKKRKTRKKRRDSS